MKKIRNKEYWLRRIKKIERQRRRKNRKHKHGHNSSIGVVNNNFVGSDYLRVLRFFDDSIKKRKTKLNRSLLTKGYYAYERIVKIPENFSITENPESVLDVLNSVVITRKDKRVSELLFDYSKCIRMGLSASTILDIIVLSLDCYRNMIKHPMNYRGNSPQNMDAKEIFYASGLPHHLNAQIDEFFEENPKELFNTVKGIYSLEANKADSVATNLTLYFDRCLKTQGYILNSNGHYLLGTLFGEVITNCEIHGGKESTWYIQGYYRMNNEETYGEMQLLFLNIGNTIYEGLKEYASTETKQKLEYAATRYKNSNNSFDEEEMYTIFALQEGISRLRTNEKDGYSERGTGTVSMIEFFYDLGKSGEGLKPQMSILSGNTQIIFDDSYRLEDVYFDNDFVFGTGTRKIIAFNDNNDMYKMPDKNNVKKIKGYFPGTIISLRFYLDSRYIEKRKAGDN